MALFLNETEVLTLMLDGSAVQYLIRDGQLIFPSHLDNLPDTAVEHDDDSENQWYHLVFLADGLLDGNATDGFTNAIGQVLTVERSEDLLTWTNDMIDAPDSPVDMGDGTFKYRARSIYPVASLTRTGQLSLTANFPDPRVNPIDGVRIAGEVLTLPNYPYQLPDDAAQLQTDLVAAGFTGATVTGLASRWWVRVTQFASPLQPSPFNNLVIDGASQALDYPYTIPGDEARLIADLEGLGWEDVELIDQAGWEILIPDAEFDGGYNLNSNVTWPPYLVRDIQGNLTSLVGSIGFSGEFVNEDGVRTNVAKQFSRLRLITPGIPPIP